MNATEERDDRTYRLIGAVMVFICLFLSFASFASIPLCVTTFGMCFWSVCGIGNLIVGVATLVELALSK